MKKLLAIVFVLGMAGNAWAANLTWTGAVDDNWHNPGNWDPPGIPGSDDFDSVIIDNNDTVIIYDDAYAADLMILYGTLINAGGHMQNQFGYELGSSATSVHEIQHSASFKHDGQGATVYDGVLIAGDGSDVWFSGNGLTVQGSGTLLCEGTAMMEVGNFIEWWGPLTLDSGAFVSVSGEASADLLVGELVMDPGASMSLSGAGRVWLVPFDFEGILTLIDSNAIWTPDPGKWVELVTSGVTDPKYGGDAYLLHVVGEPECFEEGWVDDCGQEITAAMVTLYNNLGQPVNWCWPCHCRGDANMDCFINAGDITQPSPDPNFMGAFASYWQVSSHYRAACDINYDGFVNAGDINPWCSMEICVAGLAHNFPSQCPEPCP